MSSLGRPRRTPSRVAIVFVVLIGAGLLYLYRLALTPDGALAARVHRLLTDSRGVERVSSVLAKHYRHVRSGRGNAWHWDPRTPAASRGYNVTALIGEYRIVFLTSVEAMVVLDDSGTVKAVEIRRTIDAP
jgi:hypothetical protein